MSKKIIWFLIVVIVAVGAGFAYSKYKSVEEVPVVPEEKVEDKPGVSAGKATYVNASRDMILVELPFPDAVVGKEFSVIGRARGPWYFEASFPIDLLDKDGKVIAQGYAEAKGEWMTEELVSFRGEMKVPDTYIGPATLVLKKSNASGLPEHEGSISFPITVEY